MTSAKTSFITTVLNEEKTIEVFLDSLFKQTRMPDEIVIVDGGSSDGTINRIKNKVLSIKGIKTKIIVKKGNRSVGRNEAIKNATSDIITVSDAGCVMDKNWLRNIAEPFENKKVDVVAGFYKPKTSSVFEKCLATYTSTMADRVDPDNFLPSSRSVAFRKEAWKKVGGYPEELDTCEDLVFDKKLKNSKMKFLFAKNAFVWWPQRKNIYQAFKQFFSYAKGDGQAFYIRRQTPFLFLRYVVGVVWIVWEVRERSGLLLLLMLVAILFYCLWSIAKNYKYVRDSKALIYLPLLQFVSDLAVILGFMFGLVTLIDI